MSGEPWMKFYPADWRSDPALRLCSRAARGTWIDMLSIMHEAEPYGELRVNGNPLDAVGLAKLLGERADDIAADLAELESNGVFSRRKNGIIYSRRMEKDENRRRKNRENGKKGGNPTLWEQSEKDRSLKPADKARAIDSRSQKLESDSGSNEPEQRARESNPSPNLPASINPDPDFDAFWEAYPHHVGKREARQAWGEARRRAEAATIVAGARRYAETKPPDRQWMNPANWLAAERWDDEPAAIATGPPRQAAKPTGRDGYFQLVRDIDSYLNDADQDDGTPEANFAGAPH